jgi:hypothetical protein
MTMAMTMMAIAITTTIMAGGRARQGRAVATAGHLAPGCSSSGADDDDSGDGGIGRMTSMGEGEPLPVGSSLV